MPRELSCALILTFTLSLFTNNEPLPLSEFTNSATFPHATVYYNPPSTRYVNHQHLPAHGTKHGFRSTTLVSHFPTLEEVQFQPPQVNEEPPQM